MQLLLQKCEHLVKGSMFYRAELESVNSAVELCSFYCQSNTVNENFCSLKKECWEQENSGFLLKLPILLRKLLICLGSKLKVADSIYGFLASHLLIFGDSMLPIGWQWRQTIPPCRQARGSMKTMSTALELVHSKKIVESNPNHLFIFKTCCTRKGLPQRLDSTNGALEKHNNGH